MKRNKAITLLLLWGAFTTVLGATNGDAIIVKGGSIQNNVVSVIAESAGKDFDLACFSNIACQLPEPGEYVMLPATKEESIYQDCTNVALYRSSLNGGSVERIGIFCSLRDDTCGGMNCVAVQIPTIASKLPESMTLVEPDQPRPEFSDYPVQHIYKGKPVAPILNKSQLAFRTRIQAGAKAAVEFAGHYTIPRIGCGTSCNSFYIVDSLRGHVYDGFAMTELPGAWLEQHGTQNVERMEFHPNSSLLKINGCPNESNCRFYDYEMVEGTGLKLVRKELLPKQFQP